MKHFAKVGLTPYNFNTCENKPQNNGIKTIEGGWTQIKHVGWGPKCKRCAEGSTNL